MTPLALTGRISCAAFLLLAALTVQCGQVAHAGIWLSCGAPCFSKVASVVSVAANAKNIVAGAKKVRHPKRKATK